MNQIEVSSFFIAKRVRVGEGPQTSGRRAVTSKGTAFTLTTRTTELEHVSAIQMLRDHDPFFTLVSDFVIEPRSHG